MIGHNHIRVINFLEGHHDPHHVHVTLVGEDLLEIVSPA
ncbi:uncharacterized protein METZ01_LOCUS53129, partial [marine metagenome]